MALHGCLRCLKYIVFSTNFIVWVAGMAILGLAIYLITDTETNNYIQAGYQEDANHYRLVLFIFVGTGVLMTFVGFLGCCGAFHESKCMLVVFFTFLLLIFLAEVSCGVVAYIYRNQVEESVTDTFTTYVKDTYGKDEHFDEPVDLVQRNFQCCGGEGPSDWIKSYWVVSDPHHTSKVPDSCCKTTKMPKGVLSSGVCGVAGAWIGDKHPGVHSKSCGSELVKYFRDKLWIMMLTSIGIATTQLVSMIFSLSLAIGMRQQRYGGYKS